MLITQIINALVALKRISAFLSKPESALPIVSRPHTWLHAQMIGSRKLRGVRAAAWCACCWACLLARARPCQC